MMKAYWKRIWQYIWPEIAIAAVCLLVLILLDPPTMAASVLVAIVMTTGFFLYG